MSENVSYLHLLEGNIHIFYTLCSLGYVYPRLAIRTKKNKVAWISGIEQNQGIETELKSIALEHIGETNLYIEEELERKLLKENRNYF